MEASEPTTLGAAAEQFRRNIRTWNDTPEERDSTRGAMKSTCREVVHILATAERDGTDIGVAAAGCVAYLAESLPLLIGQIEYLETRLEMLEEER